MADIYNTKGELMTTHGIAFSQAGGDPHPYIVNFNGHGIYNFGDNHERLKEWLKNNSQSSFRIYYNAVAFKTEVDAVAFHLVFS